MLDCELKFCMQIEYKRVYEGKRHAHPCWELVYYLSGAGTSQIGGGTYDFTEGMFSLIPPSMPHTECGTEKVKVLYIGFNSSPENVLRAGVFTDGDGEIKKYMSEIWREMQDRGPRSARLMNLLTSIVLIRALDIVERESAAASQDRRNELDNAINYIESHYMDNITGKELAAAAGYSYDYFRKLFKERMNAGLKEYIAEVQFRHAREMLFNSDKSIKNIALDCGYASPAHFCAVFKKNTGETPRRKRKKGMENIQLFAPD